MAPQAKLWATLTKQFLPPAKQVFHFISFEPISERQTSKSVHDASVKSLAQLYHITWIVVPVVRVKYMWIYKRRFLPNCLWPFLKPNERNWRKRMSRNWGEFFVFTIGVFNATLSLLYCKLFVREISEHWNMKMNSLFLTRRPSGIRHRCCKHQIYNYFRWSGN